MLAKPGGILDSKEYWYEIKWDGVRALLFRDNGDTRLMSRNGKDISSRSRGVLDSGFPNGTVVDGELVAFHDGAPDFAASLSLDSPKIFVAFDMLYSRYQSIMGLPLEARRSLLDKSVPDSASVSTSSVYSDGRALFDSVSAQELEGVVAKRIDGAYLPGKRTDSWIKIKRQRHLFCIVIGYIPDGDGFKSLLVASDEKGGSLAYVGKVGTGFNAEKRARVSARLHALAADTPILRVDEDAAWLDPGLYCEVRFTERTREGILRSAVFVDIVEA